MFKAIFKAIKDKIVNLFNKITGHKNIDKDTKVTKLQKPQKEDELPQTKQPELAQHITPNNKKAKTQNKSKSKMKNIKDIAKKRNQSAKKNQASSKVLPKFDDKDMNKIVKLSKSYLQLGSFNSKVAQIHFYKKPQVTDKKNKKADKNKLETHHYFNVKVLNPCYEYKTERCSANERIYDLKPGQIVHISGVLYFDKKNHRTNLVTIGNHYMTGSTHYVKPVK